MPKRREPSSTMAGIFTRSRAEIFVHRTRSGRARPDPARRKRHHHYLVPIPPTTAPAGASAPDCGGDGAIHMSIKDLRARRVFSPTSVPTECFPDQPSKIEAFNDVTKGLEKEGKGEQRNRDVFEELPGSEVQGEEERVQTTPPDLDFLRKLDQGDRRGAAGTDAEATEQVVQASGDYQQATDVTSRWPEPGSSNPLKNRPGIAPCSRSKLYRNPSSFGYRRLLPYLLDLEKDLSSGVEILHPHTHAVEVEKNMEERPLLVNADPPPTQKDHTAGLEDPPTVVSEIDNLDLVENHVPEIPKSNPQDVVDGIILIESPDSSSESSLQAHSVTSDTLEIADLEFEPLREPSYSPPTGHGALSVEELAGDVPALPSFPRRGEEGCRTPVPALETDGKTPLAASQTGSSFPLGKNHALAPKKGILKRHPRGCRGLCMCLDCASFRLHAERAYEFSRSQMQEADEVVLRLMKELSCLRNMVEKSIVPVDNGAANYTVLQLNQEQVKGVCRRASRVEELAKSRLRQMIHELNIHCRVPGPRVSFAKCVEERCIP